MPEITEKEIFIATPEDPNHEYIITNSRFSEVSCGACGFYLLGVTKVQIELTKDGDLLIMAYINDKFVAKHFVFCFKSLKKRCRFYQRQPMDWFGFEVLDNPE